MDNNRFITIENNASIEYTEKKSVFIASAYTVQTDGEAQDIILDTRRKYPDASHHCYGYILKTNGVKRFSDAGEPSGTAGMPILNVIEKMGLCNTLTIVTRYFGGIKLGAGGLVRAYSAAAAAVLTAAGKAVYAKGSRGKIEIDYDDFSGVERMLLQLGCIIEEKTFSNSVTITLKTLNDWDKLAQSVSDMCRGGAICEFTESVYLKENK